MLHIMVRNIGRKLLAGIALVVAAMVIKRYMKKRDGGDKRRRETDR